MGKLTEESLLYSQLSKKYEDNKNKDISLAFFNDCVEAACKANTREIHFVLFKLRCLYEDIDAGIENANIISKIVKFLAGNNMKASFMITVLETALEEKSS